MSKKYLLKTMNDSYYEVFDESHLWRPDTWIILVKGVRNVILYFGKHIKPTGVTGEERSNLGVQIRSSGKKVGHDITKGGGVGQQVFYIKEGLIKKYMKERKIPQDVWDNILSKNYGHTSIITKIYLRVH